MAKCFLFRFQSIGTKKLSVWKLTVITLEKNKIYSSSVAKCLLVLRCITKRQHMIWLNATSKWIPIRSTYRGFVCISVFLFWALTVIYRAIGTCHNHWSGLLRFLFLSRFSSDPIVVNTRRTAEQSKKRVDCTIILFFHNQLFGS